MEDMRRAEPDGHVATKERLPTRPVHGGHFPSFSGERLRGMLRDWLAAKGR
jgi:hypothetical protein